MSYGKNTYRPETHYAKKDHNWHIVRDDGTILQYHHDEGIIRAKFGFWLSIGERVVLIPPVQPRPVCTSMEGILRHIVSDHVGDVISSTEVILELEDEE